jgi:hypothetical protein
VRILFLTILATLSVTPLAQASEDLSADERVQLVQPQVVISIEHVEGTGDVVQLHYRGGLYDEAAIKRAIDALAASTGSQPGTYQFMPGATADEVSKAIFIAKNVVDPSSGDIRLQPVVRAFMAGAQGSVESFSVRIVGMAPNAYSTLASYNSKTVALRAFYDAATPSIEYRILVLTDDPSKVQIPPRHIPDEMQNQPLEEPRSSPAPLLVGLIVLAGASAGALVYFFLLGKRS